MLRTTLAIALFTFASASFGAGDAENGKTLFEAKQTQQMCLSCHGVEAFTSPDRKIMDLNALDARVRLCDSNLETNWFDTDIHDVVAYLNEQYYQFPTPDTEE